jgi:glycosyltransferase involved in cell wall biosynthesis
MNVFHIPSWFPSKSEPLDGVFVEEQIIALSELNPDLKNIISKWGHFDSYFPIKKPWKIFEVLIWRLLNRLSEIRKKEFYFEIITPVISWHHKLPFGGDLRLINSNRVNLKKAIDHFGKIDLIHAHISYPAGYLAYILSKEFKIPYCITEHMGPFPFPSLLKNGKPIPKLQMALDNSSAIISVSQSLKQKISEFTSSKNYFIPNLVNEKLYTLQKFDSKKFIFFTLAGMNKGKGIDHLLMAISIWKPSNDKFKFIIGGEGPDLNYFKKIAKNLNVNNLIEWVGFIKKESTPYFFNNCHVFVLPSLHESFGIVYAEANACGKPVIATKCGGPESIVNDLNGKLIKVGDPEELAKTMQYMAENYSKYDPILIRKDFENRFSRQVVVKKITDVYQEVLSTFSKK